MNNYYYLKYIKYKKKYLDYKIMIGGIFEKHSWVGSYENFKPVESSNNDNYIYDGTFKLYDNSKNEFIDSLMGYWVVKKVNGNDYIGTYTATGNITGEEYKWINVKSSDIGINNTCEINCVIISKNDFIQTYDLYGDIDEYVKLYKLISEKYYMHDINILIGHSNNIDIDYEKYFNNNYYSLYIDNNNKLTYLSEKQYHMYTINISSITNKNTVLSQNLINNINVGINISHLIDRKTCFDLAMESLKTNGKFIFQYIGKNKKSPQYYNNPNIIKTHFKDFIISHDNKSCYLKDECVNEYFNNFSTLSPITPFLINDITIYDTNIKEQYLKYLKNIYIGFTITLEKYSYLNYTYPVYPNNSNIEYVYLYKLLNICIENLDKIDKILDKETIDYYIETLNNQETLNKFNKILHEHVYTVNGLIYNDAEYHKTKIYAEIEKIYYYYVCTKI